MSQIKCNKFAICFYHGRRVKYAVSDAEYDQTNSARCEGEPAGCALYQVIDKVGFLKCPPDLKPGDMARVAGIIG
jgi:hypothetical protein